MIYKEDGESQPWLLYQKVSIPSGKSYLLQFLEKIEMVIKRVR